VLFKPHRMHETRTIAIDNPGRLLVCKFVSLSITRLRCANMSEQIEVLLQVETLKDPRDIVLDGSPDFLPRIRCGQITLVTC